MHYKAILFDLDGTLLDTLEDLATAANRALDALGLPAHPVAAYRLFVGDGLRTLAERLLPDKRRSAPLVDALMAALPRRRRRSRSAAPRAAARSRRSLPRSPAAGSSRAAP